MSNSLAAVHPELIVEWSDRNLPLTPDGVTLEAYDFSGKKIILFATSGGSGFGNTAAELKGSVSDSTEIVEGKVISPRMTEKDITRWVATLNL